MERLSLFPSLVAPDRVGPSFLSQPGWPHDCMAYGNSLPLSQAGGQGPPGPHLAESPAGVEQP